MRKSCSACSVCATQKRARRRNWVWRCAGFCPASAPPQRQIAVGGRVVLTCGSRRCSCWSPPLRPRTVTLLCTSAVVPTPVSGKIWSLVIWPVIWLCHLCRFTMRRWDTAFPSLVISVWQCWSKTIWFQCPVIVSTEWKWETVASSLPHC